MVLGQQFRFYLDRGIRLVKNQRDICFKFSPYIAGYIVNNTAKRQQLKLDDVKKANYKQINNASYRKTIKNVARQTHIYLINEIETAQKFPEKPHCVDFRVIIGQMSQTEEQEEASIAEKQQQDKTIVEIEMRKLNHFISKLFANGFYLQEYSKLKLDETCLTLIWLNY